MWYKSGTVSLTNGSTAVVGTGTSWIAGAAVGEGFIGPDGKTYEIANIASDTSITLGTAYQGSTASGQSYQIIPSQSYIRDLASQAATLISDYGTVLENAGTGKFGDGTVSAPGIRFTADENTGIRRTGADTLAIVVNGADKVTISPTGVTGITKTDVGLANVDNTSDATKNAATATLTNKTINLANNTLVATSAQLAAAVTDETGSGSLVFSATAALTGAPTAPTATAGTNTTQIATTAFVGTAVTNERTAAATLTNKTLTSPVITTPTLSTESIAVTTNNFPTVRPSLNLDFANSQTIDPRITFTRASTATRTNSRGLLETVASGTPRIDFDPITLACRGLLVEEARTNLLAYSQDFDNIGWGKQSCTCAPNAATAPDGMATADKMVETTAASTNHFFSQSAGVISGTYTFSIYLKAAGRTKGYIQIYSAGGNAAAFFDLAAGSITTSTGTTSIQACADGWFRVTASNTFTSASATVYLVINDASGNSYYTGDGASGLMVWGAQLEAGAFPTSYIPTTTAAATRAAEVATMTGTNFSSWYRQNEGAFVCTSEQAHTADRYIFTVTKGQGTYGPRYQLTNSRNPTMNNVNDALVVDGTIGTGTSRNPHVFAFGYRANDYALAAGGVLGTPDTAVAVPAGLAELRLGVDPVGINALNGHIRSLRYYPQRLSNAQLQMLTAQ